MYREWKKIGFPKEYCIRIWKQQDQEADQEIDGCRSEGGWKSGRRRGVAGKSV